MRVDVTANCLAALNEAQRAGMRQIVGLANTMAGQGNLKFSGGRFLVRKSACEGISKDAAQGITNILALLKEATRTGNLVVKDLGEGPAREDNVQALRMGGLGVNETPSRSVGLNSSRASLGHGDTEGWYDETTVSPLPADPVGVVGMGDGRRSFDPEDIGGLEAVSAAADRIFSALGIGPMRAGEDPRGLDPSSGRKVRGPVEERTARLYQEPDIGKSARRPVYSNSETDWHHDQVLKALAVEVSREMKGELPARGPNEPSGIERVRQGLKGIMRTFFQRRPE